MTVYFMLTRVPEFQAEEILTGGFGIYERANNIFIDAIKKDRPDLAKEDVKKRLRENIDPVDALDKVILPAVKEHLENLECYMVERGYRLPRWHRPEWLENMEGREYKGWRALRSR